MARQRELAQLEAERDRLLSMIAYHNRPLLPPVSRAPPWLVGVAAAIICGVGVSIVAGFFAGQISSGFVFLVVGLLPLAYILCREITVFGITLSVLQIVTLSPGGPPAGEEETYRRLADCEARIVKFKEGRS